ncbi:MAG: PIN domain-containing protein [Coleofasciculus sp. D1-CHI-01]|uniref:PIN domain-containing protein n=1 Tax=Coleofasciculus sp. D1-CHI-01 TaxID=3068482 RepID=UPI0032FE21D3
MDTYVVDTHVLVWFLTEDKRLSPMADQILTQAEAGEVQIFVPTLVLAEITHIAQKNRVAVTIHQVFKEKIKL